MVRYSLKVGIPNSDSASSLFSPKRWLRGTAYDLGVAFGPFEEFSLTSLEWYLATLASTTLTCPNAVRISWLVYGVMTLRMRPHLYLDRGEPVVLAVERVSERGSLVVTNRRLLFESRSRAQFHLFNCF